MDTVQVSPAMVRGVAPQNFQVASGDSNSMRKGRLRVTQSFVTVQVASRARAHPAPAQLLPRQVAEGGLAREELDTCNCEGGSWVLSMAGELGLPTQDHITSLQWEGEKAGLGRSSHM